MEFVAGPDALVMSGGGIEDAAFALGADPGPRFGFRDVIAGSIDFADLEDGAVFGVMVGMDVSFVPGFEFGGVMDGWVVGEDRFDLERAGLVVGEAATDELVEPGFITEAPTGAVDGDEAAAVFDVVEQVLPLLGGDGFVVGVEEEGVVAGELVSVIEGFAYRGDVVEVDRVGAEGLGDHGAIEVGRVVVGFVSEEEDTDGAGAGGVGGGQEEERCQDGEGERLELHVLQLFWRTARLWREAAVRGVGGVCMKEGGDQGLVGGGGHFLLLWPGRSSAAALFFDLMGFVVMVVFRKGGWRLLRNGIIGRGGVARASLLGLELSGGVDCRCSDMTCLYL